MEWGLFMVLGVGLFRVFEGEITPVSMFCAVAPCDAVPGGTPVACHGCMRYL